MMIPQLVLGQGRLEQRQVVVVSVLQVALGRTETIQRCRQERFFRGSSL